MNRFHQTLTSGILALALAAAGPLGAQVASIPLQEAALRGHVVDASLAPVADALVSVSAPGHSGLTLRSDSAGDFTLPLTPGTYSLRVIRSGFVDAGLSVEMTAAGMELPAIVLQINPLSTVVTIGESVGYLQSATASATKTLTPLLDIPQSVAVVTREQIEDQLMLSIGDVARFIPGLTAVQGENNRDQLVIRGNSTSADFFVNGVRDDVQYFRDLYNLDRVEVMKGANAMAFGRGGGGGVVNRVVKEASFMPVRQLSLFGGSFGDKRLSADFDQPVTSRLAFRLNGVYQNSGSFRDYVGLDRYALNPTITFAPSAATRVVIGFEHLHDARTADRGIPSWQGRPAPLPTGAFFGNPNQSNVFARVNSGTVRIEHTAGTVTIRNNTVLADYDRGYQNFVAGAVTADGLQAAVSSYNNATQRRNFFNQTDLTRLLHTGRIRHTVLAGVEAGRQFTDNLRNSGYFNNASATSILVPLSNGVFFQPAAWRHAASDAFNHTRVNLGAVYAQDQIVLNRFFEVIAGIRFDYFDLRLLDHNTTSALRRIDRLVSPRAGLVFKPLTTVSLYGSYSVSYLPSSGDQFSALSVITQTVKPEKFTNYEAGLKWELSRNLAFTTALYRLNRTNTRSTDPNDPTRIVQTGSTRTNGFEASLTGNLLRRWKVAAGYGYQDAFISSATTAARAGAQVAQVPHHTFSFWNQYQVNSRLGLGLGLVNRTSMFAAVDNTVVLAGYARFDAAVYYSLTERLRFQSNAENLTGRRYIVNADNNNNLSPGSPRALRAGMIFRF